MMVRPRVFGLSVLTLALVACGNLPVTASPSLLPTATLTAGAMEKGTNESPEPTTVTITGTNLQGATLDFGGEGAGLAGADVVQPAVEADARVGHQNAARAGSQGSRPARHSGTG